MRKITQKVAVLLFLLGGILCEAQTQEAPDVKKALITARLQLLPSSPTYNPENAIVSYTQLIIQGNAEAMNALGMIYSKGIGVTANEELGIEWMEKAANAGYAKAYYNLAILYTEKEPVKAINYFEKAAIAGYNIAWQKWGAMLLKGDGVPQDYPIALSVFKKGADKGDSSCIYSLGYMYYKGFGCTQDYNNAVKQFELASEKGNLAAMYMLGLCYRNGYGITIDTEIAKYWLNKSATMGFKNAAIELAEPEAENANPKQVKTISTSIPEIISITEVDTPDSFKKVKQVPITKNISGNYTGNLLRYDWSGQNIISTTKLEINLQQDGKQLTGEWKESTGDTVTFNAQIQENAIVFHDSKINRIDHFHKRTPEVYEFKEARLQLLDSPESIFLVGNLQLFNIKERENEKPMYLILEKKQETTIATEDSELLSKVLVYPNPFNNSFELSFDLVKTTDVTASIHNITGNQLYTTQWNNLQQGKQNKTINLNVPSGYYLLRLIYEKEVKTSILIKK